MEAITDNEGWWLYDKHVIKKHSVEFFTGLFKAAGGDFISYTCSGMFPTIDSSVLCEIDRPVDDGEIRSTVFSMQPLKAPGVDGLHALFYQSQWQFVGTSVCKFIKDTFEGQPLPNEINETLIVLIPKTSHPTSMKFFRPISVRPFIYKTVTKILANRLKIILPDNIGPQQTSFVPGRNIMENVVLAHEIIHSMRRKRGKVGFMAIKVDLAKAYDLLW